MPLAKTGTEYPIWLMLLPAIISTIGALLGTLIGCYVNSKASKRILNQQVSFEIIKKRNDIYKVLAGIIYKSYMMKASEESVQSINNMTHNLTALTHEFQEAVNSDSSKDSTNTEEMKAKLITAEEQIRTKNEDFQIFVNDFTNISSQIRSLSNDNDFILYASNKVRSLLCDFLNELSDLSQLGKHSSAYNDFLTTRDNLMTQLHKEVGIDDE